MRRIVLWRTLSISQQMRERQLTLRRLAAIVNPEPPVYTFTEKDWNHFSLEQVEEKGAKCDPFREWHLLELRSRG